MSSSPSPPRRFRFGLRSLFVLVTVICVWLGYYLNWMRQRREFLKDCPVHHITYTTVAMMEERLEKDPSVAKFYRPLPIAPAILRVFGEQAILSIIIHPSDVERTERAKRLFPEARYIGRRTWYGE